MICPTCATPNPDDSRFCSQCAAPLTPLPFAPASRTPPPKTPGSGSTPPDNQPTLIASFDNLTRGTLFAGRYEIIEELGRGGMGTVYKTYDQKLREVVALKVIRPEIGFNAAAVERFKNEIKNARRIAHRNVCRLYDLGEAGLVHFISMEYVEGEDLKKFIRRAGPIGAERAAGLARQIAEGLAEAHRMGVVHRDLKPQNVMIDREGRARIMDFGLSRFLESDGLTGSGVMLGTPEYMSPEQIELRDVDGRSDLYAMGVILFEMLTGRVPFEGQTPLAVAIKHKSETPPDARDTNPLVPRPLVDIIFRCLEKDPARRYAAADLLAADLGALEKDMPTIVREISRFEMRAPRAGRPRTKRKRWTIAVAAAAVAVAAGALILFKGRTGDPVRSAAYVVPSGAHAAAPSPRDIEKMRYYMDRAGTLSAKDAAEAEKLLSDIKIYLPEKGPYLDAWKKLIDQVQSRRTPGQDKGKTFKIVGEAPITAAPSAPAPSASKSDMQTLLALVAEREAALNARSAMTAAKEKARRAGATDQNLIYHLSRYEEGNAEDAVAKNDFSGAKSLFRVLERTYALSPSFRDDAAAAGALSIMVGAMKSETAQLPSSAVDPWLGQYASEINSQARAFMDKKDYQNAGAAFLQSAFLYEKIKDSAAAASPIAVLPPDRERLPR